MSDINFSNGTYGIGSIGPTARGKSDGDKTKYKKMECVAGSKPEFIGSHSRGVFMDSLSVSVIDFIGCGCHELGGSHYGTQFSI